MELIEDILKGDEKSAARLITRIEEGDREAYRLLTLLLPLTGKAHIVGVTGPAGAGKSTLIGRLAVLLSDGGKRVGIIATDPTSFGGEGAFLGDRLRMKEAEKREVFIRSMAHRSYSGGVARAALGAVYVMEGLGKDVIILESIGAGQSDKTVYYLCDTIVTLFTPDYGDEIQLLKAGLMEIGDIIVVNKSDRPGAGDAARDLSFAAKNRVTEGGWHIPVLLVQADRGEGLEGLVDSIHAHWERLLESGKRAECKRGRTQEFMMSLLKEELWKIVKGRLEETAFFKEVSRGVVAGTTDPYSAVDRIVGEVEKAWILR